MAYIDPFEPAYQRAREDAARAATNAARRDNDPTVYGSSAWAAAETRRRAQAAEESRIAAQNKQTESQIQQQTPSVRSPFISSSQPVTQNAYEQQAMLALQNQLSNQGLQASSDGAQKAQDADRSFAASEGDKNRASTQSAAQLQASTAKSLQAQQAAAELAFLNQRASLSDSTWNNRFGQVQGAIGQVGSNNQVQHGSAGMQGNEAGARAAAFARAKEQAGRTANSALASLKGMFEDSGTMGSTMEAARAGQILGGAGAGVNQFTRDQMISDLARAAEIEDTQYAGNLTQRGQDNQMKQALLALMNGGALY